MNRIMLFLPLVFSTPCFAKDKPRITIQVVKSQASTYQRNVFVHGTRGTSQTSCSTSGTAIGTGTMATGAADANCSTTSTPGVAPHEVTRTIAQEYVSAALPDGRKVVLWCQEGFRKCAALAPGAYQAEVNGNALSVYVPDLSGKEHKVKYKAVMLEPAALPDSTPAPSPQP